MTSNKRLTALAAALLVTTASMAPLAAFAQAPAAPAAATPAAPDASAPPAAAPAPATPDAGAPPAAAAPATPDAAAPAPAPAPDATPTPPPPSADAVNTAPAEKAGTVSVSNPYGLGALWKGGDFVSRGVLILLGIMSLGSWYIMITKGWEQQRLFGFAKPAKNVLRDAPSITDGVNSLKPASPFRYIGETGITAADHHEGALLEQIDLSTWVTMSVQRAVEAVQSRLSGGLAFLATVGSTGPFIGLFGTVWGIYHALTAIGIAGQASIDKVAGPVGEALIMTAFGLFTAVPAVLGYNWLVRRNKSAMERVRNFASDLHSILLSTPRPGVARVV